MKKESAPAPSLREGGALEGSASPWLELALRHCAVCRHVGEGAGPARFYRACFAADRLPYGEPPMALAVLGSGRCPGRRRSFLLTLNRLIEEIADRD